MKQAFTGADIFDGHVLHPGACLVTENGKVLGIWADAPADAQVVRLPSGTLAPGFLDLQVNGGGGVLLNQQPDLATLKTMSVSLCWSK